MADIARSSTVLKTYFETGDVPTQQQFADWLTSYSNLVDNNALDLSEVSITAHAGGGQASAYQLTKRVSRVTTVATVADSVKAPQALVGVEGILLNSGANALNFYPLSGDGIAGLSVNLPISVAPNYTLFYYCNIAGVIQYQILSFTGAIQLLANVTTTASSITPSLTIFDTYELTALASGLTIAAPTGGYNTGQKLRFVIKDDSTSRTLTWNTAYIAASGSLPVTTVIGKQMIFEFVYNATTAKWYCINTSIEGYSESIALHYRAIVSQSGTAAPVSAILINTLGFVPVWARSSQGNYTLTQTGGFPAAKTFVDANCAYNGTFGPMIASVFHPDLPNSVTVLTSNIIGGGVLQDDNTFWLDIYVYP